MCIDGPTEPPNLDAFLVPLTAALLKFAPPKPEWVPGQVLGPAQLAQLPDWLQPGEAPARAV